MKEKSTWWLLFSRETSLTPERICRLPYILETRQLRVDALRSGSKQRAGVEFATLSISAPSLPEHSLLGAWWCWEQSAGSWRESTTSCSHFVPRSSTRISGKDLPLVFLGEHSWVFPRESWLCWDEWTDGMHGLQSSDYVGRRGQSGTEGARNLTDDTPHLVSCQHGIFCLISSFCKSQAYALLLFVVLIVCYYVL